MGDGGRLSPPGHFGGYSRDERPPHNAPGITKGMRHDPWAWINTRVPIMPPLLVSKRGDLVFAPRMAKRTPEFKQLTLTAAAQSGKCW